MSQVKYKMPKDVEISIEMVAPEIGTEQLPEILGADHG